MAKRTVRRMKRSFNKMTKRLSKVGKKRSGKKSKSSGKKSKRSNKKGPTAWNKHLMKVYREMKAKDKKVKLGQAMKEAKKTYKK